MAFRSLSSIEIRKLGFETQAVAMETARVTGHRLKIAVCKEKFQRSYRSYGSYGSLDFFLKADMIMICLA
jgi:hypothetical protein